MPLRQEKELLQHGSGSIATMRHACITRTTTNKTKTTTNVCGGIMGKSKQVDIFATSCSAVQPGSKDKTMDGCGRSLC
jgi:hypothetical protein